MKVLVLGAQGMLGRDLLPILSQKYQVVGKDLADFDITNQIQVRREITALYPRVVINAAAYTDVDGCESRREFAFAVNAQGARNIALVCAEIGARMIHLSTDYIFDGTSQIPYREEDLPNPQNVYGASKLEGEGAVQEILENFLIIRTEWLYGRHGKNFVDTIRKLAAEQKELRVVHDQRGSPTFTQDLARALARLLEIDARGIYHITNAGSCTWFEFARQILSYHGKNVEVIPISSAELGRPAKRPANSVLNCRRFQQTAGVAMRSWPEALQEYLAL